MDHGDKDADIVLQAYRAKQKVPDRIANAPELLPWLNGEYEAFFELSTCRSDGVIPWTALHHYATVNGFADTHADFQRFVWLIRAMDKVYIEKKAASKIQAAPKGPHNARGK
jgi:hypothetical protein